MTALPIEEDDFIPRVYMVQEPMRKSRSTGSPVPLFDIQPAKAFGEIVTCLDWSDTKGEFDIDNIIHKLRDALCEYCDDDFILAVGNPVALALAATIAAEVNHGYVQFLMWQKLPLPGKYRVIKCDMGSGHPYQSNEITSDGGE